MANQNKRADGQQKGAQTHAEGQHGDKAHAQFLEQLHSGASEAPREAESGHAYDEGSDGKRRLVEDRQQHDDADRNSEKVRLTRDKERGRDDGPSDNTSSLHGVLDHREHRADYQERDADGFRSDR